MVSSKRHLKIGLTSGKVARSERARAALKSATSNSAKTQSLSQASKAREGSSSRDRHIRSVVLRDGVAPTRQPAKDATKAGLLAAENLKIPARADLVAKALGSRAELAKILRVSPSQPTRWIKGQEAPNSENTRAIVDLEHVVARARLLWADDDVVNSWLTSSNGFLDGARPVDVIATQGSGPVVDALDQAMAGAFA